LGVESYFSRLRQMVDGQHHRASAKYPFPGPHEVAWKRITAGAVKWNRAIGHLDLLCIIRHPELGWILAGGRLAKEQVVKNHNAPRIVDLI